MKLDCNTEGPNYWLLHYEEGPDVLLDGNKVEMVVEADDVEGYVVAAVYQDGDFVVEGDSVKTHRLEGKVEFIGTRRTGL